MQVHSINFLNENTELAYLVFWSELNYIRATMPVPVFFSRIYSLMSLDRFFCANANGNPFIGKLNF